MLLVAYTDMTNSLTAILPTVFDSLFYFAQSDSFWNKIAIAFGTEYDLAEAEEIRTQWQNREFSQLPEIEIISDAILGDFRGGYAANSNQIYLADSFFETASSEAILTVLLEEIGHFFDAEVNEVDTAGDEGELFSGLVREYDLSEAELTRIKAENDLNYVFFGNNLVVLETSEPIVLFVDTTVDENDGSADIGAGLSLRDAISIANESPDTPHIIKLESGVTYELTYISNQATGDRSLNTAGNITIESDGNDYAAIVHNNDVIPEGFASYIISNQGNSILNLNNIAISNQDGGGLYNNGTLTVDNSLINDNASRGIYNGGIYNRGDLTIDNSIISNNIPWGIESYGNLTVDNSLISNNTSSEFGGGIFILSGTSTLTNNTITGNTANFGGGISNWYWGNTLTLTNNTITGNTANRSGGGIYNQGEADLTNNTITGNTSSRLGGGIYNGGTWSSNSTISGNISNQAWYITPDGELTTSPGYNDYDPNTGESEFIEYNLHPTYPDIYDIGDTGSFTPLPPSPEPNPEPNPEPTPQPTISISDSWVEVETDTNETTLIFEVELSSEYDKPIIVEYYTLDGSATSSETKKDYNKVSQNILSFFPGETKKEIEITVVGSSPVTDAALELFARDTAYREWKDTDIGKLVDSVYDYNDSHDIGGEDYSIDGYEDYYIDEIITNDTTDFDGVGLTAYEDLFLVLANPINAEIAENNNNLLEEIANSSGGTDTQAYLDGQTFINQLNSAEQDYTFAIGTIYDEAKPPVLAIRGSESSLDWLGNANPEGVGYDQFIGSQADINQWLSDVSNPENGLSLAPHITGHSLGGALSQWFGASYQGELGKIVTFNAPGISELEGINLNPSNNQGVKHYITSADIVSMAGSTYLNGNWTELAYLGDPEKGIWPRIIEKHLVPVLNKKIIEPENLEPENLESRYQKPTGLEPKVSDGNTTDLSDFYFTYLPDPDYFALQLAIANLGFITGFRLTGIDIAKALTFRGTTELNRQAIGAAINEILSASNTIYDSINSAWNAAKYWTSSAWNSIIEEAKETLGLSSTSDVTPQSFEFDTSTQSVNINESLLAAQTLNENTITTTESEPINNFWNADPLWTNEAWEATVTWSNEAWESITEWTPETWEMTTQWTADDWNIPFLTISNTTVIENDSNNQELIFDVSLSTPSNETITVNYATEDGTATAGSDYTATNGTLTFAAGEINKTITVPVLGDNLVEEDETVYLNLTEATNANLTDNQGTATIINQEEIATLDIDGNGIIQQQDYNLINLYASQLDETEFDVLINNYYNDLIGDNATRPDANSIFSYFNEVGNTLLDIDGNNQLQSQDYNLINLYASQLDVAEFGVLIEKFANDLIGENPTRPDAASIFAYFETIVL